MEKEYRCDWCGFMFLASAVYTPGTNKIGLKARKSNISTQVRCPNCFNFNHTFPKILLEDGTHFHQGR